MALAQVSSYKPIGRNRSTVATFVLVALAVVFVIIGNITAAGPAVYRAHAIIAQAR
jgi:hypothetical protein